MFRIKIFLLLLISIPAVSAAQVIFEYSDTSNYVFTFVPFERNINNKVLNQLALAHLKVPDKTSFNYQLRHRVSVSYRQSDSLFILLDVKPLTIKGDIQLKDFNLEKLLVPSAYNVRISINNPQSGEILNDERVVVMEEGMTAVGTFPDSLWNDGTDVKVDIRGISFTEKDYHKMELELTSIRDYYASSLLADTLLRKIQKARKNSNTLEEVIKTYITAVKALYLIEESMKVSSEVVPGRDPLKIAQKLPLLKYNLIEYTEYINQNGKPLLKGNVYAEFADAFIKSLREAGLLSKTVDYYSSPFFYKLFANSITSRQLFSSYTLFEKELNARGIDNFNISRLTHEILKGYLKESAGLIKANRYVEAVDLLSGAVKFKNLSPYDHLSGSIEDALTEARKGLVTSYTEIMIKALDKNLLSLAEKYLAEVENYTAKYKMTNSETGPFKEIYLRMADSYIHLGNNSIAKGNYFDALTEFTKSVDLLNGYRNILKERAEEGLTIAVRSIYQSKITGAEANIASGDYIKAEGSLEDARHFASSYQFFYPDETYQFELETKIAFVKYNDLVSKCAINSQKPPNKEVLNDLTEAVDLLNKYQFANRALLDTLTLRIGLKYLNEQFSKARLKYWASQPDSAIIIANEALELAARLDLHYLPIVKEQYEKVHSLAGESWCNEAKGRFNSLLYNARVLFNENKINHAIAKANEAKELAFKKATCGLTTAEVNKLLAGYKQQIRWNDLITEAFELLKDKKFVEATSLIQQAESIYSYYRLDTTGLLNVGYFDLAMKSDDISLITFAISNLISKNQLDHALQLLDKLRLLGYSIAESDNLQETLARNLAKRDIKETPDLNVKVMLKTYTKGNSWFTRFESVYKYYTSSD